jgi:O-acetyl-ADP-ribose deacetylase (regulator of RNase III)
VIKVIQADITTLALDAIVNAANETLLGGGGVDGAIHRAAGPQLKEYCRQLGGCPTGEARVSPGFKLPARWIIHTVGPVWQGGARQEAALLANCYRNCFELALDRGLHSIAFPSISTGAYGYPRDEAAHVALSLMREYEAEFEDIVACCFSAADAALYLRVLAQPS